MKLSTESSFQGGGKHATRVQIGKELRLALELRRLRVQPTVIRVQSRP